MHKDICGQINGFGRVIEPFDRLTLKRRQEDQVHAWIWGAGIDDQRGLVEGIQAVNQADRACLAGGEGVVPSSIKAASRVIASRDEVKISRIRFGMKNAPLVGG